MDLHTSPPSSLTRRIAAVPWAPADHDTTAPRVVTTTASANHRLSAMSAAGLASVIRSRRCVTAAWATEYTATVDAARTPTSRCCPGSRRSLTTRPSTLAPTTSRSSAPRGRPSPSTVCMTTRPGVRTQARTMATGAASLSTVHAATRLPRRPAASRPGPRPGVSAPCTRGRASQSGT
jgi:hypothetical protein